MKITFLGTSAGRPTQERNVTSIALDLLKERNSLWLFDCGEATQHQFMRYHLNIARLEKIFITHLHGDHIFGLPGLLTSRSLMDNMKPLTLYGPVGIKQFLQTTIEISHSWLTYPLEIIELAHNGLIFQDEQFTVHVAALEHRIPCFGYRIVEQDKPGQLNSRKLKQDQIPVGPNLAALKQGETLLLADGRQIDGRDYLSQPQPGKIITILGDTTPCQASIELAQGADLLVHEATQEQALVEKAMIRGHSSTQQAARIALQAQVKQLIVTHISPRYVLRDNQRLLAECQQIFAATQIAFDGANFAI